MRTFLVSLMTLASLLGLASVTHSHVGDQVCYYDGASDWVIREPYAAAGGGVMGETPATTVTEFRLTPFDDLIYNDEEASKASELYPGKVIGFSISMWDHDAVAWGGPARVSISLPGNWQVMINANLFSDGLLVGAGEDPSVYDGDEGSAVEPSSWGRIKAALRVRP